MTFIKSKEDQNLLRVLILAPLLTLIIAVFIKQMFGTILAGLFLGFILLLCIAAAYLYIKIKYLTPKPYNTKNVKEVIIK